jgi:hypothetical protein
MILFLVRIPLTLLLAYSVCKAVLRSTQLGDGEMVFLLGYPLAVAVLLAILWAPAVGGKLSGVLTSTIDSETSLPRVICSKRFASCSAGDGTLPRSCSC